MVHRVLLEDEGRTRAARDSRTSSLGRSRLSDSSPFFRMAYQSPSARCELVVVSAQGVRDYASCAQHESFDNGDQLGVAAFIRHASVCPGAVTCTMSATRTLPAVVCQT